MHISIEHFPGTYPSFNVSLHSAEGKEPFLVVKGARIVDGSKGKFISWPATKNEKTQKWWSHVYASEGFATAVLQEAMKEAPKPATRRVDNGEAPF